MESSQAGPRSGIASASKMCQASGQLAKCRRKSSGEVRCKQKTQLFPRGSPPTQSPKKPPKTQINTFFLEEKTTPNNTQRAQKKQKQNKRNKTHRPLPRNCSRGRRGCGSCAPRSARCRAPSSGATGDLRAPSASEPDSAGNSFVGVQGFGGTWVCIFWSWNPWVVRKGQRPCCLGLS